MNKRILLEFWILFILTHLLTILQFPTHEDETEYLLLAQQVFQNPVGNFFIYFYSSLLPMFGWLISIVTFFVRDTLLAARLLNVLLASSLVFWVEAIANLYSLNLKFRYFAVILLMTSVILFLNTRVALLDLSILVFTCWYIYFTAKLLKNPTSKWEYVGLLVSLLLAFLTKATAVFGIPSVVFLMLACLKNGKQTTRLRPVLLIYLILFLIMVITAYFFGKLILADDQTSFIGLVGINSFLARIRLNIRLTWIWSWIYFGPYILSLPLLLKIKKSRVNEFYIVMVLFFLTSATLMIAMNKFYYPRHILNLVIPLIVVVAGILSELPILWAIVALAIIVLIKLPDTYNLLYDLPKANLAQEDRVSYFEEYTSGIRVNDVAAKINSLAMQKPITVWIDGSWTLEYGLRRSLSGNKNINFLSYRLGKFFVAHDVSKIYKDDGKDTYVVVNRFEPPNKGNLVLVDNFKISFRQTIHLFKLVK